MTKQEKIKAHLTKPTLFVISELEKRAELRPFKLHDFVSGKCQLSPEEASRTIDVIKNAAMLPK